MRTSPFASKLFSLRLKKGVRSKYTTEDWLPLRFISKVLFATSITKGLKVRDSPDGSIEVLEAVSKALFKAVQSCHFSSAVGVSEEYS